MTEVGVAAEPVIGESRWPMAIAVILLIVATVSAPQPGMAPVVLTVAGIEAVLLAAIIIGDPGRIDRRSSRLRWIGTILVAFLVGTALLATGVLIVELVAGSPATNDPRTLLIAGGKVWLTNNIAFALLYWQFDGRGPAERAHGLPRYPDLAFPQLSAPDLAPPHWRPRFTDYLYIAFTTANAFSPTDTLPMTTWAKFAMATQALVSFVLLGLVLARAVNAFS